jgi:hypothetical protein
MSWIVFRGLARPFFAHQLCLLFGANRKSGAYLALVALALQIVLSFGHVHLSSVSDAALSATTHRVTLTQAQTQPPAQNPSGDDDYCAICASIFLVSTSFTPAPPVLPVPAAFQPIEHSFDNARDLAEPRHPAFQSRAPPAA